VFPILNFQPRAGLVHLPPTSELAVMLDCYLPLQPTEAALGIEDAGCHDSFR